jgi:hypothetical protein
MTAVPEDTPVTKPEPEAMVATEVALLDQVPPVTELLKVMVCPAQTLDRPVIAANELTAIVVVAIQPVPKE